MRTKIWDPVVCDEPAVTRLAAALDVPPVVARLLWQRGHRDAEAAHRFLHPSLSHLHDPYGLTDMRVAVDRLCEAIARKERVAIHGDYDVDGVTSTVILRRALEMLGGDVTHFIPERLRDGYGLQVPAVERLHAEGVKVIVSVDCGIRSADAGRRARALGVDLIITDHHEPEADLPPALAVINPKRVDCMYGDKSLAGVGVAFKVVQALCARFGREKWLPGFLKLAAMGTVADMVPLVGENRVIARLGLERLSQGPHALGLRTLLESAGLQNTILSDYHISFVLGPRINAAGRMSTPDLATQLLLATNETEGDLARRLAAQLGEENERRQAHEAEIVAEARKIVESDVRVGAHNVLVVAGDGWHRGVIGIVASKLKETFYKPTIVLSIEDGLAHGSCRSIPAFDMLGALDATADLLEKYGGHKQAAGLTLPADRIGEFRERINAIGLERLEPTDLMPRLTIDGPLGLAAITSRVIAGLEQLAPFGTGNPRPVFGADGVELVGELRRIKDRHVKVRVRQDGRQFDAIAWRAAERADEWAAHRHSMQLAYSLEKQTFRGETTVELRVEDLRGTDQVATQRSA